MPFVSWDTYIICTIVFVCSTLAWPQFDEHKRRLQRVEDKLNAIMKHLNIDDGARSIITDNFNH